MKIPYPYTYADLQMHPCIAKTTFVHTLLHTHVHSSINTCTDERISSEQTLTIILLNPQFFPF